jgi:hypothetical protein
MACDHGSVQSKSDAYGLLQHYLATLAYRTQKALSGAPEDFASFRAGHGIRSPGEIIRHMTTLLRYAQTCFVEAPDTPAIEHDDDIAQFHRAIEQLAETFHNMTPPRGGLSLEQLLQGPLADAMTHAGQITMLRRLAGSPVAPESFIDADIHSSVPRRTTNPTEK